APMQDAMPSSLSRRRFRLIALDADAIRSARAAELLPPLERLLRAGVLVLALDERDGPLELARAIRGPHKRNLVVRGPAPGAGEGAVALDTRGGAPRAQPVARWMQDALARPRGIRAADVAVLGPP